MLPIQYDLVQLRDHYSDKLLHRFYDELMIKNFPVPEELDDVEVWEYALSPQREAVRDEKDPLMQIVLALETPLHSTPADIPYCDRRILGGVVYEYYHQSACALISYIVTDTSVRRAGVLRRAHTACIEDLQRIASAGRGLRAVLMETNAPGFDDGVMDNNHRHEVLYRLGYRQVVCLYNQPPLGTGESPCEDLCLLVYLPDMPIVRLTEHDPVSSPTPVEAIVRCNSTTQMQQHSCETVLTSETTAQPSQSTGQSTEHIHHIPARWLYKFVVEFARSTLGHENDHLWLHERYFRDFVQSLRMTSADDSDNLRIQSTLPLQTRLGCAKYHIAIVCDGSLEMFVAERTALRLHHNVGCVVTVVGPQTLDTPPRDVVREGDSGCVGTHRPSEVQSNAHVTTHTPTTLPNTTGAPAGDCVESRSMSYFGDDVSRLQGAYQTPVTGDTTVSADCFVLLQQSLAQNGCNAQGNTRAPGNHGDRFGRIILNSGLVQDVHRTEVALPLGLRATDEDLERASDELFRSVVDFLLHVSSLPTTIE
ncbi:hypothetical protein SARC_08739 [Sphaeroforma arctica JP610]|uniref:Uncharacterized protein n=1 Tax=Sphaeroforma arctica JP610 TaxID=667725 RepID=A0A0L0FPV9_9EUKA|nr:hypothetical protein SARC_08739 [Sphaeroforma arctica JP610]KNC78845.1 hypothetical protein SARC_08739 [Sphaeroforma arctica JP610]|eukprot:XP_014152747.1 hypothetical protein SARC_08739 [Sphaeroforma arctica JP610]